MVNMSDFSFGDVPTVENDDLFNMLFEDTDTLLSPEYLEKSTNFTSTENNTDYAFDDYMIRDDDEILANFPNFSDESFLDKAVDSILPETDQSQNLNRDINQLFSPLCEDAITSSIIDNYSIDDFDMPIEVVNNNSYDISSIDADHGYSCLSSTTNSASNSGDEDQLIDVDDSSLTVTVCSPMSSSDYISESIVSNASSPLGGNTESMQINNILLQCTNAIEAANKISDIDVTMPKEEDIYPEMSYPGKDRDRLHANDHAPMQYSHFCLSQEEKEMLKKEGIVLPEDMPLTKQEDRALRLVRRKIRNKVSAKESRKRKQVYVDGLEKRIKKCTVKNMQLQRKVDILENGNVTLMSQLRKLKSIFSPKETTKPAQTRTCLMVMILSLALFAAPNMNSLSSASTGSTDSTVPNQKTQVNNGHSRNLLESTAPIEMHEEIVDEIPAINKIINDMVYPSRDNDRLMEIKQLLNSSNELGSLMEKQMISLRMAMKSPIDDIINDTNIAMNMATESIANASLLNTDYIDEDIDDSDEDEFNIKIESALNNGDESYIDPVTLNELLSYDIEKTINTPRKKRRIVA